MIAGLAIETIVVSTRIMKNPMHSAHRAGHGLRSPVLSSMSPRLRRASDRNRTAQTFAVATPAHGAGAGPTTRAERACRRASQAAAHSGQGGLTGGGDAGEVGIVSVSARARGSTPAARSAASAAAGRTRPARQRRPQRLAPLREGGVDDREDVARSRSSRRRRRAGRSATRPESTFGHRPEHRARHGRPGGRRRTRRSSRSARRRSSTPGAAASRSATSACTITSPRRSVGNLGQQVQHDRHGDVVRQVRHQRRRRGPRQRRATRSASAVSTRSGRRVRARAPPPSPAARGEHRVDLDGVHARRRPRAGRG